MLSSFFAPALPAISSRVSRGADKFLCILALNGGITQVSSADKVGELNVGVRVTLYHLVASVDEVWGHNFICSFPFFYMSFVTESQHHSVTWAQSLVQS